MIVHKQIIIKGKVQGVFFRGSTKEEAIRLGVNGEVWNSTDGAVMVHAEGEEAKINALIQWCYAGPPRAEVTEIIVKEGEVKGYKNFTVKRF